MLSLISVVLATAAATSEPIQVQSTRARESSNKASGFGKHLDQGALVSKVTSVSTAFIRPDGRVQLNCETHRADNHKLDNHQLERTEQEK